MNPTGRGINIVEEDYGRDEEKKLELHQKKKGIQSGTITNFFFLEFGGIKKIKFPLSTNGWNDDVK